MYWHFYIILYYIICVRKIVSSMSLSDAQLFHCILALVLVMKLCCIFLQYDKGHAIAVYLMSMYLVNHIIPLVPSTRRFPVSQCSHYNKTYSAYSSILISCHNGANICSSFLVWILFIGVDNVQVHHVQYQWGVKSWQQCKWWINIVMTNTWVLLCHL